MKIVKITSDDIKFIEFAYGLVNTARYPSFKKVTDTYNNVFGKRQPYTSCGSCIRHQVLELKKALDKLTSDMSSQETTPIDQSTEELVSSNR